MTIVKNGIKIKNYIITVHVSNVVIVFKLLKNYMYIFIFLILSSKSESCHTFSVSSMTWNRNLFFSWPIKLTQFASVVVFTFDIKEISYEKKYWSSVLDKRVRDEFFIERVKPRLFRATGINFRVNEVVLLNKKKMFLI